MKMGNKEEAYGQYGKVFSYIKTSFEKNYPKEIDRLCTRFQADQLAYQNERDRIVSMRFYLAGITVSVLFLIFLLVLGWKKIFRFEAFPDAAGGDEGESGASHTTEEYVSFEHEP